MSNSDRIEPIRDWEAIARYMAGESPADERASIQAWLGEHPSDAQLIAALDDAMAGLSLGAVATQGIDVESALASVKARRAPTLSVQRGNAGRRGEPTRQSWAGRVGLAAAAAVVLVAGTMYLRGRATSAVAPAVTIAERVITTPIGGRDSVVLPDGSMVTLGPGTRLTIAANYGQRARNISLTGEAMFRVQHDASKPFVVSAHGTDITDVGTVFVVHSDATGNVRVAVTEGIVDVVSTAARDKVARLKAGEAARVDSAGSIETATGINAEEELAWTRGTLNFRDTPLSEVAVDLERWYGVRLDIRDSGLARRPLSATFRGDSVADVLRTIGYAVGATIGRRGNVAVVRPQR